MESPMQWKHKDLLDVSQFTPEEIRHILATAEHFRAINSRAVKKVPTLKGRSVVLFFAEPSTRTKTSFDMAGKRLSADTFALAKSGSSLVKGETLKDTALTLQAMNPDGIVIRQAKCIRRWGTSKGLGQLAIEGPQQATKLDDYGTVEVPQRAVISLIDVANPAAWSAHFPASQPATEAA